MRSGMGRASSRPTPMAAAAAHRVGASPATSDAAPQKAEPSAKAPRAATMCSATARERTQGGALACVAVLKVDIADIHAAPPSSMARYTRGAILVSAATTMAPAKTRPLTSTMVSRLKRARTLPSNSPAVTAPVPRQPMSRPNPCAPVPNWRWAITGSSAHRAEPAAPKAITRTSCARIRSECQANRKPLSMPPHKRSAGRRDGGWALGGQRRMDSHITRVDKTEMANTHPAPQCANTSPASVGPTARAAL